MLGLPCEEWKRSQHMLRAPHRGYAIVTAAAAYGSSPSSSLNSANSFIKDGRTIGVGDCALFKPPQDCPPFIGIIRLLSVGEDNKLNLGVNWLYRPTEVKLGKGVLLEATPNELFFSFHKDEIPAASLLHPCRVAFLPKGIELPSGASSFVCRRVYDTTNKCLWWLTDQDYINEHQEEVNHLLHMTQLEMHAAGQPGGRSPKPTNSTSLASQLKAGSDAVQNSSQNIHSQVKGKKRERVDQGIEHGKREHTIKADDGDSGPCRQGSILKVQLAKITDKGGLIDSGGVEKLVQLMISDKNENKLDLAGRSTLAGVIEATVKYDCLSQFVEIKGLLVLNEWLQEVHKGKIGDLSGPTDSDNSVEEFLLVLLRALDKLPVNLQALQMCNIGKSVNLLRSHKNLEIQKKARGLVDTWKKRVEAEMNITDAKSSVLNQTVSWPVRPQLLEVSQGGSRQSCISSEVAVRSSVSHLSATKAISSKTFQAEGTSRQSSAPASSTSADANVKEWQLHSASLAVASDLPLETIREEKISGSSNSHNISQSFCVEQTKPGALPGKDDVRVSASATMTANKTSADSSRHRKPSNGLPVMNPSGMLKEAGTTRLSVNKSAKSDKLSQAEVVYEKAHDGTAFEGSNKLIVRIPNHGRNPAQDASSSFPDDPSLIKSRVSSPVLLEYSNLSDDGLKNKMDSRSVLSGRDEVDGSPALVSNNSEKIVERAKTALSIFGNEEKASDLQDTHFSSMNALIESCVKYSVLNATLSAVDDAGMNLLASVASGEVSKSYLATPIRSSQGKSIIAEESSLGDKAEVKYPNEGSQDHNHPSDSDENKNIEPAEVCHELGATNLDGKITALASEEKSTGEKDKHGITDEVTSIGGEAHETVEEKPCDTILPVLAGVVTDEVTSIGGEARLCETNVVGKIEEGGNDGKPLLLGSSSVEVEYVGDNLANKEADDQLDGEILHYDSPVHQSIESEQEVGSKESNMTAMEALEAEECSSTTADAFCRSAARTSDGDGKVEFDLNEGLNADDGKCLDMNGTSTMGCSNPIQLITPVPFSASGLSNGVSASITVAAAAKGTFLPPEGLLQNKAELGWKGPAATSAFRPAEPRKVTEMSLHPSSMPLSDARAGKQSRPLLDIDLNVADERMLGDVSSHAALKDDSIPLPKDVPEPANEKVLPFPPGWHSVRVDVDLNQSDETLERDHCLTSSRQRINVPVIQSKPSSDGPLISGMNIHMNFDLNDGPAIDESNVDPLIYNQYAKISVPSLPPIPGFRMSNSEIGNLSSWFPSTGNTYSAITLSSIMSDRGDRPFPVVSASGPLNALGPGSSASPIGSDVFREPVLSSSPAVSLPSGAFQYPFFHVGPNFPLASTTLTGASANCVDPSSGGRVSFPMANPQLLGTKIPSHYPRPFVVSIPEDSNSNGSESCRKWARQGLDLNVGPGGSDVEGRDDNVSVALRQLSVGSSQVLAEENAKMFHMSGSILKRKEPEGGWDGFKHSSWQ